MRTGPDVLHVDLDGDAAASRRTPWGADERVLDLVGRHGGSALALALVSASARAGESEAPFVIAAGEAVRDALPTAARACVASRAPLSGRYADGHVGGLLGPRVAAVADAIAVRGCVDVDDAVLVVAANGDVRVERVDGLADLEVPARLARLRARFVGAALLVAGPAGDAGIPYATLANEAEPPSFVGRGGLGALLRRHGLRAIALLAPTDPRADRARAPRPADAPRASMLTESARLVSRAAGGTFEARGALDVADPGSRKGCRGCPTPCGYVFERAHGAMGARQGAIEALGDALGLEGVEGPLALLERCDARGVDAKEVGAALALLVAHADRVDASVRRATNLVATSERASTTEHAPPIESARALHGDLARLLAVVDAIPTRVGLGALVADGAASLARALGVDAPSVRGQAVRVESDLASLLGQCVSTRGADPMRTFAFLAADVPDRARLARLVAPWPLPERAEDPRDPAGKGRLVAWTESFLAAVDASGFCAFSAAALLADGVLDLDELARWIAPSAVRANAEPPGRALLAAGATIALAQRDLARAYGADADEDRPAFAARALDAPGMLDEYRAFRGLDARGAPTPAAWDAAGSTAVLDLHGETGSAARDETVENSPRALDRRRGRVVVRAAGPLGAAIGASRSLELELPSTVLGVLEALARSEPSSRAWLVRGASAVPVVARGGARVASTDLVRDGDVLDLVVALSGG